MGDWKSLLKADPTDWLLEKDSSSVRYFTLTDILERPKNHPEVVKTRSKKELSTCLNITFIEEVTIWVLCLSLGGYNSAFL